MNRMMKGAAITALVGAAALASVTQSEARSRWIGPAAAGFAAGAIVGSAATGAYAYSPGYYSSGYTYAPAYTYETAPAYDAYAYEAAPVYVAPRWHVRRSGSNGCHTAGNYGQWVDESACNR